MDFDVIIAAIGALVGGGGIGAGFVKYLEHRRAMKSDDESVSKGLIETLILRIEHLESDHKGCMERNRELSMKVGSLEAKNEALTNEVHTIREALARVEGATSVKATVVADDTGTIEEWSPGAAMMFGWNEAEAIGQNVQFIMPGYLRGRHHAAYAKAAVAAEETINASIRDAFATDKSGMTFPVTITVSSFQRAGKRMFKADILRRILI